MMERNIALAGLPAEARGARLYPPISLHRPALHQFHFACSKARAILPPSSCWQNEFVLAPVNFFYYFRIKKIHFANTLVVSGYFTDTLQKQTIQK